TLRPQILNSPAGRLTAIMLLPLRGNEKGGWCKPPSSITDPPKPESESRFGSGHPGKPILYFSCRYVVQTVCQRFPKEANPYNPFEKRDLTFRRQSKLGSIAPVTYKISQVRLQYIQHSGDSPFSQSQDRSISTAFVCSLKPRSPLEARPQPTR